jgi:alginate O-acetyltransferase complex protein AlgI
MVFSSVTFLFYLLPLTLALYFLSPRWLKNAVLLLTGLVFYVWGAGTFVLVVLLAVLGNWALALVADKARQSGRTRLKTAATVAAVVGNLLLLGYYKYVNFFVAQINVVGGWFSAHFRPLPDPGILLPIGISFITFQAISYVVDVAKGKERALANPIDYGMYIAMFPHSLAGPIVRLHHISAQIRLRRETWDDVCLGAVRFAHGLAKKVLIADSVSVIAAQSFGLGASVPCGLAWLGLLAFAIQIYFDFSGYSDMAIGMARMFGFTFPENFLRPYSAVSMTDFWRRWHLTLTSWFRDYMFLPMTLNRKSEVRVYVNLALVFLLIGFWHGAKWTFVVFGLYHAAWMCWERFRRKSAGPIARSPEAVRRVWTFFWIILSMVLFRAENLGHAWSYFQALFGFGASNAGPFWFGEEITGLNLLALAVGIATLLLPRDFVLGRVLEGPESRWSTFWRLAVVGVAMPVALALVVGRHFQPFIYFQF